MGAQFGGLPRGAQGLKTVPGAQLFEALMDVGRGELASRNGPFSGASLVIDRTFQNELTEGPFCLIGNSFRVRWMGAPRHAKPIGAMS